jgi:class 3 adenylate cyclase/tetratricopeptide (TPR) repeat protein
MSVNENTILEGTITLLSTDMSGSTVLNQSLGDEVYANIERGIKKMALEQISKHNGIVINDTGDGLMAAFRSARRAVACAKEFHSSIAQHNRTHAEATLRFRIGLHTGELLSVNGEYSGETLIITKRIEEVAPPGGIFVSETVYGVLGTDRKELEDRGDFNLKGISTPWHLYEVPWVDVEVSGVLPSNEPTPFVGRSMEFSQLIKLAERAKKSSGAMVLIGGEAGIGKTRLTDETAREARRLGLLVLAGHCLEMENAPPYLPNIEQIEHVARIVAPEALRKALGDNAPEVAKLVPELRRRFPDIPDPVALPPEQEQHFLIHGVCQYIERAAQVQPMLLIYEDLHWADESTLLLLHHLAQRLHEIPVMVVGTYRHTEVKPGSPFAAALPNLLRRRLAGEILLKRFSEDHVSALLEGRAGHSPPSELVSLFYFETEGNPFFVEELFRHLQETGKLLDDKGRFKSIASLPDTEVPRGVRLLISQRLQGLSKSCQRLLTCAAGIGTNFDINLISRLTDLDEDTLLSALDEAVESNILREIPSGREALYNFTHEQIRQTLLAEISTPRRQRLHQRIADTMEQLYGEYVEKYCAEIAHHLYQAGALADGSRTARYLLLAGERARAASAFDEAIKLFETAETVLPSGDSATLGTICYSRGMALRGLGRMEKALTAFQHSIDLLPTGKVQDRSIQARANLLLDLYRGHEAVQDLEKLLSRARETGNRTQEMESLLDLGKAYYIISLNESGGGERALECYEKAYRIAKDNRDKTGMVRALFPTHHLVDYWLDFRDRAKANIEEAVRLSEEIKQEELICDCTQARFRFLSPKEVSTMTEALLQRIKALRDPLRLKEYYFYLMWHYLRTGEFDRSVEACDLGTKLADELGAKPVQYNTIKALALINLGRYGEAWEALQEEVTEEAFGSAMQKYGIAFYLMNLLAFGPADDQAQRTSELAKKLNRAWMRIGMQNLRVVSLARLGTLDDSTLTEIKEDLKSFGATLGRPAMAEVLLLKGSLEEALKLSEEANVDAEKAGIYLNLIPGLELSIRILLGLNRPAEALAVADEALKKAEQTGYHSLLWRILIGRAEARKRLGDEQGGIEDHLAAARILNELMETIPDVEHRRGFETNPLVAPILAESDRRKYE